MKALPRTLQAYSTAALCSVITLTAEACASTATPAATANAGVQPAIVQQGVTFQTAVAPQPDEDLAEACRYKITLTDPSRQVRGVWVIFERSRDTLRYYQDADVRAYARRHDLALLFPFHCRSKSETGGDMNVDPSKGLGRALFAALTQLAQNSSHPELASAKLILLGFSGTGSLVGRLAEFAPDRVLAVIPTDPGHFDPLGVDTIRLSPKAAAIPHLILTGSADAVSGTQRPYAYFRKVLRPGRTLDVRRPEPGAALLHHERQGPDSGVAGCGCRSEGDTGHRALWLHRNHAERSHRLPGSKLLQFVPPGVAARKTRGVARIGLSRPQQSSGVPTIHRDR